MTCTVQDLIVIITSIATIYHNRSHHQQNGNTNSNVTSNYINGTSSSRVSDTLNQIETHTNEKGDYRNTDNNISSNYINGVSSYDFDATIEERPARQPDFQFVIKY